jgi:hypothetical protein
MTSSHKDRVGADATPVDPHTPDPAPDAASLSVSAAGRGQAVPTPAARAVPAAVSRGAGRDEPSRIALRGGGAGPAVGTAGPAATSPPESPTPGSGGARGKTGPVHPPASPRSAPTAVPPFGSRGTPSRVGPGQGPGPASTSPPAAEGRARGDEGGGRESRVRTAGERPSPVTSPAGGRLSSSPPAVRGLRGKDALRAWKAAESAKNATQRRGRARRPNTDASPGVGRLRVAAPRSETFDVPPPPTIRVKRPEPPDEAA